MTDRTDFQTPPRRDEVEEARRKVQRLTDDFRPVRGLLDMSENESIIVALLVAAGTLASALSAAEGAVKRLGALEAYLATTEDVHLLTFGADVVTIEVGGASPLWPTVRRTGPHALRDALDGLAAMRLPEAKD